MKKKTPKDKFFKKGEILSFIHKQRYLYRTRVMKETDIQKIVKRLSKEHKLPIKKITYHHDLG